MNPDLQNPKWMYVKAAMFTGIGFCCAALIWMENPNWKTAALLALLAWASARIYYFMFYVIEKYADPNFKFSGVISFLRYLATNCRGRRR